MWGLSVGIWDGVEWLFGVGGIVYLGVGFIKINVYLGVVK